MINPMLTPLRKPKSHRLAEARRKFIPLRGAATIQWTDAEINELLARDPQPLVANVIDLPMTRNYDIVGRSNTF